jgi:hyperosmotically inducible protein
MKKVVSTVLAVISVCFINSVALANDGYFIKAVSTSTVSDINNVVPDTAITTAIKTQFAADSQISALSISVETTNGTVTLTGTVPSEAAKQRAINLAQNTQGVKTVVEDLIVQP